MTCTNPQLGLSKEQLDKYPECGFDTRLAYLYGESMYNSMINMRKHQDLVEYNTPAGGTEYALEEELDKIYLPHLSGLSGTGELYYKVNQVINDKEICGLCAMDENERPSWLKINRVYNNLCSGSAANYMGTTCDSRRRLLIP